MRRTPFLLLFAPLLPSLFLLAGAGCAPYQRVGVESRPSGALVFADGEPVGTTPLEIRLSTEIEHAVFVKKEGYKPELVVMRRNTPDDPPPFLTPADVRVRLTRKAPRAPGETPASTRDGARDPNDPAATGDSTLDLLDPLGRDLEIDVDTEQDED